MTQEEFSNFATRQGWKTVGDCAYVLQEGYPITVRLKGGKTDMAVISINHYQKLSLKLRRAIKKSLPKGSRVLNSESMRMNILCAAGSGKLEEVLVAVLDGLAALLKEHGAVASERCPICKKDGCDAHADVGGYRSVHRKCVEERASSKAASAEAGSRGSYLRGVLGAALGSLVAAIPTVFTIGAMERVYSLLYALVPLGAYYGYKLLGGKMDKAVFYVTLILSAVQIMVIEQLCFYVEIVRYFGIFPSILETTALYFRMDAGKIIASIAPSALFMAFGVILVWGQIRRTATHELHDAGQMLESLTGEGVSPPPAAPTPTRYSAEVEPWDRPDIR